MRGWVRVVPPVIVAVIWMVGCDTGLQSIGKSDGQGGAIAGPSAKGMARDDMEAMFGETQACCFEGEICENLDPMECMAAGGHPQGPGTSCETTECDIMHSAQACCFEGEICENLDPMECMAAGGHPQGMGTLCETVECDIMHSTQACCFEDETCEDMEPMECMAAGGHPRGMGTLCATTDCSETGCGGGHGGGHGGGGHHGGGMP